MPPKPTPAARYNRIRIMSFLRSVVSDGSQRGLSASRLVSVSDPRLGEREHAIDDGPECPGVDQPGDLGQLLPVRLDDEERLAGARVRRALPGRRNGDQPPARPEHAPGPGQ